MSKVRLCFAKEGVASYISHLDLLRTFQRVFIRAGMVIRHSAGFHPHPMMSFVLPLSVGQTSVCELLDFETEEEIDCAALPARLAPCLPLGVRALECHVPERPVRELQYLQALVSMEYDNGVPSGTAEAVRRLLLGEQVVVEKRNKRKQIVDVDIRPMIHTVEMEERDRFLLLRTVVQAQNPGVNPALLATAVSRHLPERAPDFIRVHRERLLDGDGSVFR